MASAMYEEYTFQHWIVHTNMSRYHTSYGHSFQTQAACTSDDGNSSWILHLDVHVSYQVLCKYRQYTNQEDIFDDYHTSEPPNKLIPIQTEDVKVDFFFLTIQSTSLRHAPCVWFGLVFCLLCIIHHNTSNTGSH